MNVPILKRKYINKNLQVSCIFSQNHLYDSEILKILQVAFFYLLIISFFNFSFPCVFFVFHLANYFFLISNTIRINNEFYEN